MESIEQRKAFTEVCERVAGAARATGATLAKSTSAHSLVVSRYGKSVEVPIVSDESDWRVMTPEEALYAVVQDTYAWAAAHPDAAKFASLSDSVEQSEIPDIEREFGQQMSHAQALAEVLGGPEALTTVYRAAGLGAAS